MTGTGLCKPWILLKIKPTNDPRRQQTWDWDTVMQMEKDDMLFEWGYSCLHERWWAGGGGLGWRPGRGAVSQAGKPE